MKIYFLTEKLDDAKKDFEKAIAYNENFVAPRLQLGYCLCKLAMQAFSPGMMQDANKLLDETTKKFPNSGEAWSLFGQVCIALLWTSSCLLEMFSAFY